MFYQETRREKQQYNKRQASKLVGFIYVCMVASIYSKPRVLVSLNWRRVHIQGLCDTYCHLELLLAPRGSRRGLKDSRSVKTSWTLALALWQRLGVSTCNKMREACVLAGRDRIRMHALVSFLAFSRTCARSFLDHEARHAASPDNWDTYLARLKLQPCIAPLCMSGR